MWSWALKVPWMVRVFRARIRVTFWQMDVPILCIPIDAKYKKTETIGFTRFRPKIKKRLKSSEIGKNGRSKMFICKTSKSDVDKKTIKNGKWILSRILLNFL
jgi:hypothetical protein